jgi:CRISPR-associated protein Csy2
MTPYLLLPHMRIHNANALSSLLTVGVPAMTGWLGAVHALERKIKETDGWGTVRLLRTGISFHKTDLQVCRGPGGNFYLAATANPLTENGERPPLIGEPRIHLEVSLLVELKGVNGDNEEQFLQAVRRFLPTLKMAGGDILSVGKIQLLYADQETPATIRKVLRALMPGYVLVERRDLMNKEECSEKDSLARLLYALQITYTAEKDETGKVLSWTSSRAFRGWVVPISVGYRALTPCGRVRNQRDPSLLHQFAENVITLGEFKMPYRFNTVDEILWQYCYDKENEMYLCVNQH